MANDKNLNQGGPSAADSMGGDQSMTEKVSAAASSAKETLGQASERAVEAYTAGNAAVASKVDVIPAVVVAALAGVVVGYFLGSDRRRGW